MIICFDTAVLIWGIQGVASPSTEGMIGKTKTFIESLEGQHNILISTPVLTEFLQKFPRSEQSRYVRRIAEIDGLLFQPFDVEASLIASELQASRRERELKRELHSDRVCIKTDLMILAIAIVAGADQLVTPDFDDYQKLASNGNHRLPEIRNVPNVVSQPNFFDSED